MAKYAGLYSKVKQSGNCQS
ncbi:hypothetical protein LQF60_12350 [Tetragenococcus koreensis]|uniref:Uncharacterized protein n=2 Tax=Enterococcus TaxID=1350 RepID=A0AAW8ULQ8_ENTCA|nr:MULTISPECIES: hypothetical protein [Enterococcaceae]MDN5907244.1 hypothetical protein [Staphylococcus equorum]MDN6640681.1 hypothetical protein [Tetragenococcus sp.]MDN6730005.1 hypothetical protein [Alkalibacterium sp.]MDT2829240.1 hypothetical protein [Enterococcus viikkiensis]WIV17103.1 hypothetical protein QN079_03580 [Enterococcus sp. FZMF]